MKYFIHQPRPWQGTSKLVSVFVLTLTICEYSDLCSICCTVALDHWPGWLGEQWHWLGGKMNKCFHRRQSKWNSVKKLGGKKKREWGERKRERASKWNEAGGMKHNAKRKTPIFLGSPSLANITYFWQNPCGSWGEKTRKYVLYVSVFAPFSVVPLQQTL